MRRWLQGAGSSGRCWHGALPVLGFTLLVAPLAAAADREVAWVFATGQAAVERDVNAHAARGLRFAAATDGLPCAAIVMQAPADARATPATYRVVTDRDLSANLAALADEGYEPRGVARPSAGRSLVIWERAGPPGDTRRTDWRVLEFDNPDTLQSALAPLAHEGFAPALLARIAFRSWPGLSEKGLLLLGRSAQGRPREVRVVRGTTRKVDAMAAEVESLSAGGWRLDVAFTVSRDGNRTTRRERAYFVFSREEGAATAGTALKLARSSSWGAAGSGEPIFTSVFWDEYLFVWRPADRRRTWASPTRLSDVEANCAGLALKLRLDGDDDQRSTIVAAVARPVETGGYELIVVLDERFGFSGGP